MKEVRPGPACTAWAPGVSSRHSSLESLTSASTLPCSQGGRREKYLGNGSSFLLQFHNFRAQFRFIVVRHSRPAVQNRSAETFKLFLLELRAQASGPGDVLSTSDLDCLMSSLLHFTLILADTIF